jgi:hypothetical protein
VSVALVAGVLAIGGVAEAQSNPQQLAEANRSAMEAYNNLDIEAAKAQLEKAAKGAEKNGIRGPSLARTYSNLAVVLVGGLGDKAGGTAAFTRALKEDPKVEPDPIVATPEVMASYNAAKASLKNAPAAVAAPVEEAQQSVAPRDPSAPVEGNLDHTPATEQLSQTAIPIFVKKSTELDIATVKVMYRSTGMKKPKSAEMSETDDGYTYLIPCTDVFEPVVEYFIVAKDGDGKMVGNSGTSDAPIAVPIVSVRTAAAPSLPGQVAPSQCSSDDECPPGMPGCGGSAGLGDTCSSDSDCSKGLVCDDDFCSSGEREEEEEEEASSGGRKRYKKYYVEAAFGVGLTAVGKGRAPDRNISKTLLDSIAEMSRNPDQSIDREKADTLMQAHGFDCDISEDDMQRMLADNCTVAVNPGGVVPVALLNLAVGYYLTPKIAVALTGRFQIGHGEGPLAGILLGGRGEYLLTKPADTGLRINALAGFGVGQMQARPPAKGSLQGPYATNANVGGVGVVFNLGAKAGYRFTKNIGVNFTPSLNFGLPNFLFALDMTAGAEFAF